MALNNSNLNSTNNNNGGGNGAVTSATNINNNNNAENSGGTNENLVVRIDDNSQDNLQALFDSVLKPNETKRPLQIPFRMRKLPSSFFNPPTTGSKSPSVSHSRENSADSAFGSGTTTICSPNSSINPVTSRLQISHSRAHSSPASLQQTYAALTSQNNSSGVAAVVAAANAAANSVVSGSVGLSQQQNQTATTGTSSSNQQTTPQQQPIHMKQRSYDVVSAIQLREELGELPHGWEQARTAEGQIYYLK